MNTEHALKVRDALSFQRNLLTPFFYNFKQVNLRSLKESTIWVLYLLTIITSTNDNTVLTKSTLVYQVCAHSDI